MADFFKAVMKLTVIVVWRRFFQWMKKCWLLKENQAQRISYFRSEQMLAPQGEPGSTDFLFSQQRIETLVKIDASLYISLSLLQTICSTKVALGMSYFPFLISFLRCFTSINLMYAVGYVIKLFLRVRYTTGSWVLRNILEVMACKSQNFCRSHILMLNWIFTK